jgi:hypothetical protein
MIERSRREEEGVDEYWWVVAGYRWRIGRNGR